MQLPGNDGELGYLLGALLIMPVAGSSPLLAAAACGPFRLLTYFCNHLLLIAAGPCCRLLLPATAVAP